VSVPAASNPTPRLGLGLWNFYFILKFVLVWRGLIGLHPLENLAFAAALAMPLGAPAWRRLRTAAAIPCAVALLYYDSFLPPASRLFAQAHLLANFGPAYLFELAGRFIQWPVVAALVLAWVVFRFVATYIRVGTVTVGALCVLAFLPRPGAAPAVAVVAAPGAQAETPDQALRRFYESEARRAVGFPKPSESAPPFDVIFIQICSLSWDDLQATQLDQHHLWRNADFLFHHFNSAASYSGPAAVRFLRGPCGQLPHRGLYDPGASQCYLMPSLQQAGFDPQLALNHDGHFDDFLPLVRKQGLNVPPLSLSGLAAPQRSFDDSAIYDDYATLTRWLELRAKSGLARAALFYNTISLHDGNRLQSGPDAGKPSAATYRNRVDKLLSDVDNFIRTLEGSGRRAVVVVAAEHGAALRGDKMQIAGLREIATPAITTVPVAIKVIGPGVHALGGTAHVDDTTSYLAISHIVARMIDQPPFGAAGFAPGDYLAKLPTTPYVTENESAVMLQQNGKFLLKQGDEDWKVYDTRIEK